jgi:hypothetical protein
VSGAGAIDGWELLMKQLIEIVCFTGKNSYAGTFMRFKWKLISLS